MANVNKTHLGVTPSSGVEGSLPHWVREVVDLPTARVRSRLRGNNLHLLFECEACPPAAVLLPKLRAALTHSSLECFLPAGSPQVYRVVVYGRETAQASPQWTESFDLAPVILPLVQVSQNPVLQNPLLQEPGLQESVSQGQTGRATVVEMPGPETNGAAAQTSMPGSSPSALDLARQGQPAAIAHYLSSSLSHLGISIRARLQVLEGTQSPDGRGLQQLTILCEAAYIPDPLQLVEDLAKQLRELDLKGFREALVFGQVQGEAKPEWVLRVDLTPPERLLREWARWGDVQAIVRLLNRALKSQDIQVSALLKDITLHLTCGTPGGVAPDQAGAIATLAPLLTALKPQGIHSVAIYGIVTPVAAAPATLEPVAVEPTSMDPNADTPLWVHWLDLPASRQPHLGTATLTLAQQGNLEALTFLLNRLLNPQLDRMLTTGGVRAQVRQKADVLHIMTDALNCPPQKQVAQVIGRFMQPLQIPGLVGIRVYGRKAGQKLPLWNQGIDFVARGRLVPEATPEFSASDAYVGDLLTPAGPLVVYADANVPDWQTALGRRLEAWRQWIQRSLVQSQVFILQDGRRWETATPGESAVSPKLSDQRQTVALVWGAIGTLLVVQSDWVLGWSLRATPTPKPQAQPAAAVATPRSTAVAAPPAVPSPLPKLILKKSKPGGESAGGEATFNNTGFTTPGETVLTTASVDAKPFTASPLFPKAPERDHTDAYPTFNSRQIDEKLALYQQYMAENGGAPEVLVVGSSRALRGVDPAALRQFVAAQGYGKVRVFNFGINGATAQVVDVLVRQMIPQEALPKIIIWADGARAFNSGREDITFNAIAASPGFKMLAAGKPPIPGQATNSLARSLPTSTARLSQATPSSAAGSASSAYDQLNQVLEQGVGRWFITYPQRDRLKTVLRDQLAAVLPKDKTVDPSNWADATSPSAAAANTPGSVLTAGQDKFDIHGFLPLPNRFNPVTYYQKYARVSGDFDSDYQEFGLKGAQANALISLAQFAQARQMSLVFVNLPLTDDYLDGTRRRHEEVFQQSMLQLSAQTGFLYRDLSGILLTKNDFFSDPSHLNRYGGYEVSRRLAQDAMIPWNHARQ